MNIILANRKPYQTAGEAEKKAEECEKSLQTLADANDELKKLKKSQRVALSPTEKERYCVVIQIVSTNNRSLVH